MTTTSVAESTPPDTRAARRAWLAVLSVAVGSFTLVTNEFLPVGLLSDVAADLYVSEGTAGTMITAPGMRACGHAHDGADGDAAEDEGGGPWPELLGNQTGADPYRNGPEAADANAKEGAGAQHGGVVGSQTGQYIGHHEGQAQALQGCSPVDALEQHRQCRRRDPWATSSAGARPSTSWPGSA
ncbi:hypothetical protein [Streptomyces sp. NPDC058683]|uniref:hypothetical protein n=1 Tax=Streptomyces sp. NPDC058683 TaxID=3346597 RepID=UPI003660ADCD